MPKIPNPDKPRRNFGISNGVNWKIKVSRIAQAMYKVEITILELNDTRQDENLFVKRKK